MSFIVLAALAFGAVAASNRYHEPMAKQRVETGTVPSVRAASDVSDSNDSKALAYLDSGLRSWRDASPGSAKKYFERAIELDPNLAPAHLYASMLPRRIRILRVDDEMRAHHQAASVQRARLSPRDRALLEAQEPLMAIPPDAHAAEMRLLGVRELFPSDWIVLSLLGQTQLAKNAFVEAAETFDILLRNDPSSAMGWLGRAFVFGSLGDTDRLRDSLDECLRMSAFAEDCWITRMYLDMDEGRCAESEQRARTILAMPGIGWETSVASSLASSIYGRGGSTESVRAALAQFSQPPAQSSSEPALPLWGEADLYTLTGEFSKLRHIVDVWARSAVHEKFESMHMRPFVLRFEMATELGEREVAKRLMTKYLLERDAWLTRNPYIDLDILVLSAGYRAGGLSDAEFEARRRAWLTADTSNTRGRSVRRWLDAYARVVMTQQDAAEALRVLPHYLPIASPFNRSAADDAAIGHVYLLADDLEHAIPLLQRAVNSCWALGVPFDHTWANLHLGLALEKKGDLPGACAAYNVVLKRWGHEPRSLSAKTARARHAALRCSSGTVDDLVSSTFTSRPNR
ncbi:tetratricopeptide repeat protein [Pendulispora albinea]|uniref:Tetratricopeptide repeat protein n=1 Tax=Pendulispora albinea TaxID=2741071 RepID=A0ABZ2LLJ9_9BACT